MTDEPFDHYQRALTALAVAEEHTSNPEGTPEEHMRRDIRGTMIAQVAATHAALAIVDELRRRP